VPSRTRAFARGIVFILFGAVTGCSGGAGSGGSPAAPIPVPAATPASGPTGGAASVTFTIKWPAKSASGVRPHYLPATALSASVGIYGGTPQYINNPTSTLTFTAPVGLDTFLVQSYDEQNGKGNVLSSANITETVSSAHANILAATLNGVIASLKLALSASTTPAGAATVVNVMANGLDADGNTIVGPGDYNEPITLSIVDPANSGTLSLSKKLVQAPGAVSKLNYNGSTLLSASIVASAAGVPSVSATFAPTPTFTQFGTALEPEQLTAGPDGNIWFTDFRGYIGMITPAGAITEYPTLTADSEPEGITAASDGRLWFTEEYASKVGAITTSGAISEYATAIGNSAPFAIIDRGDGTVWYTGLATGSLESLPLTGGTPTVQLSPGNTGFAGIAVAPNHDIFFANGSDQVVRLSNPGSDATLAEVTLPSDPQFIVLGPDGNLWFTETGTSQIGAVSPLGFNSVTQYSTLSLPSGPFGITVGTDGALWFTEEKSNRIGRITTSGDVTEYQLPGFTNVDLGGIAMAKDGSLWFGERSSGAIGHLVY